MWGCAFGHRGALRSYPSDQRMNMVVFRRWLIRFRMDELNWNLIRAFQATLDEGSLSGAARALGLTQPTLSRQVSALEAALKVTLFERVGRRLELTEAGRALVEHADAMGRSAQDFALAAAGQTTTIEGTVSVSASDAVAFYLLPGILARARAEWPGIAVEVISSNALSDLRRREADIAIRHVRPEQPELIARFLREATAGFFASRDWIARHGHPRTGEDLRPGSLIGFERSDRYADHLRALGVHVDVHSFPAFSESSIVSWQLARAGLGITPIMHEIAESMPDMVEVLVDVPTITFPLWLVAHGELRTARRVRAVFDILAEELGR